MGREAGPVTPGEDVLVHKNLVGCCICGEC